MKFLYRLKHVPFRSVRAVMLICVMQIWFLWTFQAVAVSAGTRRAAIRSKTRTDAKQSLLRIREMMGDPDLYYDDPGEDRDSDRSSREGDGGGSRRWVWSAGSTIPRDVLLAAERPPHLHVVVTVRDIHGMLRSMDRFVGHYEGMGVTADRIVFDILRRPALTDDPGGLGEEVAYQRLVETIVRIGADYSTGYIMPSYDVENGDDSARNEHGYVSLLAAMRGLPLNDWILMVRETELVSAWAMHSKRRSEEAAIWEFFDGCERDGVNSVQSQTGGDGPGDGNYTRRLVAVRGYLRPDPGMRQPLSILEADRLFDGSMYLTYTYVPESDSPPPLPSSPPEASWPAHVLTRSLSRVAT